MTSPENSSAVGKYDSYHKTVDSLKNSQMGQLKPRNVEQRLNGFIIK